VSAIFPANKIILTDLILSQKKVCKGAGSTVVTYYCAQLEGPQSTQRLHKDGKKRRGRVFMPRYDCGGWMQIIVPENRALAVRVRIQHNIAHPHYSDISLLEEVQALIEKMKSSTPSDVSGFPYAKTQELKGAPRFGLKY
jgi:hypothetical protein